MHIDGTKFRPISLPLVSFDGATIEGELTGEVSFESYAGSGDVQIDLAIGGRSLELILGPDDALALADLIKTYAEAGRRHKEGQRRTKQDDRAALAADRPREVVEF